jgi:asparagine synthetase B (glutamine-hydrolysing)
MDEVEGMSRVLPEEVRLRRSKLGFSTPQREWLRKDVRGTIRSMIHEPDFKMSRILSTKKVHDELDAFLANKSGCLTDVEAFRVLNLELWARTFAVS